MRGWKYTGKSLVLIMFTSVCDVGCPFCCFKALSSSSKKNIKNQFTPEGVDKFIEFALKYQENITALVTKEKNAGKAALPVALAAGALAWFAPIVAAPIATWNVIGISKRNKKIEEQQYNCCTMKFYLDGLSKFLGM